MKQQTVAKDAAQRQNLLPKIANSSFQQKVHLKRWIFWYFIKFRDKMNI